MVTPTEIKSKAQRLYPKFIKSWLCGDNQFPIGLRVNLEPPSDIAIAKREIEALRTAAKESCGRGYTILWRRKAHQKLGKNNFPEVIQIDSREDLLHLVGKVREFARFERAVTTIRSERPELMQWLRGGNRLKTILSIETQLNDLLGVLKFFRSNPRPECYMREIPLSISTKVIEDNKRLLAEWLDLVLSVDQIDHKYSHSDFEKRYGLRKVTQHVLVRILDPRLQDELHLPFAEFSLPVESINQLKSKSVNVFIVENKINLLTLPTVARGIAIGGLGKAVAILQGVDWLGDANLIYWGDLDIEGLQILAQFRKSFEKVKSILMDIETLRGNEHLAIGRGGRTDCAPENLNFQERAAFDYLKEHCLRIEQEHIPQIYANQVIGMMGLSNCGLESSQVTVTDCTL